MKIFGYLEEAAIETVAGSPTNLPLGRIWLNTSPTTPTISYISDQALSTVRELVSRDVATNSLEADIINEFTLDAGVTIDSVLLKDGLVDGRDVAADGTAQDSHIADATIHFTEASIDHLNISNVGTNTHAQIDTHIASVANPHTVTKTQVSLGNVDDFQQLRVQNGHFNTFTPKASPVGADILLIEDSAASFAKKEVTLTNLFGTIDHTALLNIGTNTHAQIDTHISLTALHIPATEDIVAGATITLGTTRDQKIAVKGDDGVGGLAAVTAAALPFGASPPPNGTEIKVFGTDDTGTVTIPHSTATNGAVLQGACTLKAHYCVIFVYMANVGNGVYIETSRNF